MKTKFTTAVAAAIAAASFTATGASAFGTNVAGASASASASASAAAVAAQQQGQVQGQLQGQGQNQSMTGGQSNVNIEDQKQAPAVAAPGFSSGHPCGIAPASFGISFIGGAITGGGQVSDDACLLAQMGYTDAAMAMIASRNSDAFKALEQTGHIARKRAPVTSSRSQPAQSTQVAYTSCKMDDGAIRVGVRAGSSEDLKARAVADCRSALSN